MEDYTIKGADSIEVYGRGIDATEKKVISEDTVSYGKGIEVPEEKEDIKSKTVSDEDMNAKETTVVPTPVKKDNGVEKHLFLQFNDLEFSDKLMFEAAMNDYCMKNGTVLKDIKSVNLYVKPQEGKAYYVIDEDPGKKGIIEL